MDLFLKLVRYTRKIKKTSQNEVNHLVFGEYSKSKDTKFLNVVNLSEKLLQYMNLPYQLISPNDRFPSPVLPSSWNGVHPIEKYDVKIMGRVMGSIISIHPLLLKKFKIKGNLSLFILNLNIEGLGSKSKFKYSKINKFPGSSFDCTVDVNQDTPASSILNAFKKVKSANLKDVSIKDVFLKEDRKYITITSKFEAKEKTLDGKEIKELESGNHYQY